MDLLSQSHFVYFPVDQSTISLGNVFEGQVFLFVGGWESLSQPNLLGNEQQQTILKSPIYLYHTDIIHFFCNFDDPTNHHLLMGINKIKLSYG